MSTLKPFSRGLWLFLIILVLAVLVWRFGYTSNYFLYSLGAAAVVAGLAALAIFKIRGRGKSEETNASEITRNEDVEERAHSEETDQEETALRSETKLDLGETIQIEEDYTDIPPLQRNRMEGSLPVNVHRLDGAGVAAGYRRMAGTTKQNIVSDPIRPSILAAASQPAKPRDNTRAKSSTEAEIKETDTPEGAAEAHGSGEPPVPMIEDQSSLTLEEINELVNAVWYRCENPYCKYTTFLTVHHFVDEKDGGANTLDNLIVLCPYCHDLAHKNEMPKDEMHEWVSREDRFKFKPDWHYF